MVANKTINRNRKEPTMKAIAKAEQKDNKKNSNRGIRIVTAEEYEGLEVNGKVELIKALIPLLSDACGG